MIKFHYATLDDKARIDELLHNSNERGCEYSFTNLFAWSAPYQLQVASVEGCLTTHMTGVIGPCYLYPVGGDTKAAILALAQDAAERGEPLRLGCLSAERRDELESFFPGCFEFNEDRDGFDYLYDIHADRQEAPRQAQPHQQVSGRIPGLVHGAHYHGESGRVPENE